jgi:hypothetical protein
MGYQKQPFISKIISSLRAAVNDYSLRKITADRPLDYHDVKHDMYIYRQTVGDYARRAYGKKLLRRFIGVFTDVTYL